MNYVCQCGEVVKKAEREQHDFQFHTAKPCAHCGITLDPELANFHDCEKRPRICQFCDAHLPADSFAQHVYECGSRTELCPRCNKFIPVRDFEYHVNEVDCTQPQEPASDQSWRFPGLIGRQIPVPTDNSTELVALEGEDDEDLAKRIAEAMNRTEAERIQSMLYAEMAPEEQAARPAPREFPPEDYGLESRAQRGFPQSEFIGGVFPQEGVSREGVPREGVPREGVPQEEEVPPQVFQPPSQAPENAANVGGSQPGDSMFDEEDIDEETRQMNLAILESFQHK